MTRQAKYKPLLFTTTVRNPERLKEMLNVLREYDGEMLDGNLAEKVSGEIIRHGLYTPTRLSVRVKEKIKIQQPLTDKEVATVLRTNPQKHKEAGFDRGWPSRFDTWFKLAKEFGFVFYQPGDKIKFSAIGLNLAANQTPEFEQQAYLNALVKYQRNNPFRRVRNENVPLLLLLSVIARLNADNEYNDAGISRLEIPLILYWKDNDAEALYKRIKQLRREFGYNPSGEVIAEICRDEIMESKDIARNDRSIIADYPDEFIRKMRLTGLVSLRGGGRFIDINKNEQEKTDYVLARYSQYEKHDTEERFFAYMATVDEHLISFATKQISYTEQDKFLELWVGRYEWGTIKEEMLLLSKKRFSQDNILKYLSNPVRLEFLTALAVKSQFADVTVIPNYPVDDEGIPTSTAAGAGDTGDIECFEGRDGILIEVTMAEGRTQTMMEVWPISRHLKKFETRVQKAVCYFVAPSIFTDTRKQIAFVKQTENRIIAPRTIAEFLMYLENSEVLYSTDLR